PELDFRALGYEVAHHGLGRWNGVAIVSRIGLEDVVGGLREHDGWTDDGGRFLSATCGGVRMASIYVPNGREVGSEFFAAKLAWLDRLKEWLRSDCDPGSRWPSAATTTSRRLTTMSGIPRQFTVRPTSLSRSGRRWRAC